MSNRLFIGIDEAGYGPNLGPLVVSRSVWQVPGHLDDQQLCDCLSPHFMPRAWSAECKHIPLGDSKQLYQSTGSLRSLEAGVLSMLAQLPTVRSGQSSPSNVAQLLEHCGQLCWPATVAAETAAQSEPLSPWYSPAAMQSLPVPVDHALRASEFGAPHSGSDELCRLVELASTRLSADAIELLDMQALIVREAEFNRSVDQHGSKGHVLADATLQLVVDAVQRWPECQLHFYCDRQGGRKDYLPLLLRHLPDDWFHELHVDASRSSYRRQRSPEMTIHFSVKGDSFPPTGLASMLAKYVRERCMQAFNAFWLQHLPELRPTAGYPVDAKRFRQAIESTALALGLEPASWWRCK